MAVSRVTSTGERFHCLKADTKPTTGVNTGARLLETDTGGGWEYNGAAWVPEKPIVEGITLAQPIIEYAHHEVHGGSSFSTEYYRTTAATINHRTAIYLQTGPKGAALCHLIVQFSASFAAIYSVHEDITLTANIGTHGVAIYNRYRDSVKTSTVWDNATVPVVNKVTTLTETQIAAGGFAAGTILRTAPLVAGSGPKAAGGSARGSQEYILGGGKKYIFMITNSGNNANVHHILLDWYEHTNRN